MGRIIEYHGSGLDSLSAMDRHVIANMRPGAAVPQRHSRLAGFTFSQVDEGYVQRAREAGTHAIVAGENYGQGSSREHAVIAPRYLGLRLQPCLRPASQL